MAETTAAAAAATTAAAAAATTAAAADLGTTTEKVWRELEDDAGVLVWVFLGLYLTFLLGLSAYSYFKNDIQEKMHSKSMGEQVVNHYAANRNFNDVVLTLTMFATTYSGYTVVGVPEEMYTKGFFAYRWLWFVGSMTFTIMGFACRLQFLSKERDYVSPTDFVADRHNSHILRALCSCILCFASLIYVLAQFKSMGSTVEALSNGDIKALEAASVFCVIMLLYEIFGGLRAIAYTDAIQGFVLVLGFTIFFGVQEELFGGIENAGNYLGKELDKGKMLTEQQIQGWVGFSMPLFFAFCLYPQMVQRYHSAKNTTQVKRFALAMVGGHWLANCSSLSTGIVAIRYFGYENPNIGAGQAFGSVMLATINAGGGYNILGSIMITASVAAFMSTADSALHGFTCCLVLDLVKPYGYIYKYCFHTRGIGEEEFTPFEVMTISKVVSIAFAILALMLSDTDFELGPLLTMQNAVLMQGFPTFFLGFIWRDIKAIPCILGLIFGVGYAMGVQCSTNDCVQSGVEWYEPIDGIHPAVFGLLINFIIVIGGSLTITYSGMDLQPNFDKIKDKNEFPDEFIGVNVEPFSTPFHWPQNLILLVILILNVFVIPWWRPMDEWGEPDDMASGLPKYIRDGLWFAGITAVMWVADILYFWEDDPREEVEKTLDEDENQIQMAGSNDSTEKRQPETADNTGGQELNDSIETAP